MKTAELWMVVTMVWVYLEKFSKDHALLLKMAGKHNQARTMLFCTSAIHMLLPDWLIELRFNVSLNKICHFGDAIPQRLSRLVLKRYEVVYFLNSD